MKAKSLKLLVIKEICSWLQTFHPSNPGGKHFQNMTKPNNLSLMDNGFTQFKLVLTFNLVHYLVLLSFSTKLSYPILLNLVIFERN